jgi:hypothetical protein
MFSTSDLQKINFYSEIEIDKIFVNRYTGTFTGTASPSAGNFRISTHTISNPEGVNVLPILQWSVDNTNWYDGGNRQWNASVFPTVDYSGNCYTTGSNIVIVFGNATTSGVTVYYRVLLISEN